MFHKKSHLPIAALPSYEQGILLTISEILYE